MTDADLLQQWIDDASHEAFDALVRRHVDMVHAVALRRVDDIDLARDVTQATFIVLARKAGSVRRHTTLAAWLHQVTRHAATDALRKRRVRRKHEREAAMQVDAEHRPSDDPWLDVREHIEPALDRLPRRDREAILLRFYEQQTFEQIAAVQGVNVGTAHRRVQKALEKLAASLRHRGVAVPAAALATTLTAHATTAAPAGVAAGATSLALATGSLSGAVAGAGSLGIAKGAMTMMTLAKLKVAAALAVAAAVLTGAGAVAVQQATSGLVASAVAGQDQNQIPQFHDETGDEFADNADTSDPPDIDDVIAALSRNEQSLEHIYVQAAYKSEFWDAENNAWIDGGDGNVKAWHMGRPGGKMKLDMEQRTRWIDGAAPFSHNSMMEAYNGRVRKILFRRTGDPAAPDSAPRGQVEANRSDAYDAFICGWRCSLFGIEDHGRRGMRVSEYFQQLKELPQAELSVSHTGVNRLVQVVYEQPRGGKEVYRFDSSRGYALMHKSSWTADGTKTYEMSVEELDEPVPGVFYPRRALRRGFSTDGTPRHRTAYVAEEIVANDPGTTDDTYDFTWPVGTTVHNTVSDIVYTTGPGETENPE